jgi:hypothetical protein
VVCGQWDTAVAAQAAHVSRNRLHDIDDFPIKVFRSSTDTVTFRPQLHLTWLFLALAVDSVSRISARDGWRVSRAVQFGLLYKM